ARRLEVIVSRDLVRAYLAGEVRALQPDDEPGAPPFAPSALARAVARARRPLAPEVHTVLAAQNARLAPSPARDAHLEALGRGAAVVVTGQQVGLFLGPLYTIYKAASAVVVARTLAAESGAPVVPVFWLQTEDHDLVEIASANVPGAGPCETIAAPIDRENRISIAHHALPPEIGACIERLEAALGEGSLAQAHIARLRRHYRAGASWSGAFAGVLAELFAPEGLVMIDPRDPALAAVTAPVHARALVDADRIAAAMVARCGELERAGASVPVHVRPGAPLSFFHPEGALGPRVRLEPAPGEAAFAEVGSGSVHEAAALLAVLRDDPRRFSTSALLRPIVQDALLPTVAYVGGPAEVAYFAQLGPLYRAFERTPPLVVPRAKFRVTDHRTRKLLDRLGLAPSDAALSEESLLARLRPPGADGADVARRLLEPFVASHGELAAELADAGPQIARALARTRGTVERAVGKLAGKVERARLYADAERVDAVRRVRALLAPGGAPQERTLCLAALAARVGDRELIERVLAAIDPFDGTLKELAA
ncbi:MAG TPA: bacillithiol biosynthesis cysteine-adding enzyme BshC, partial [Kofleriaceae bacterium]|nr:bacillithiol biosynthesis cysteine-adding enzyme BshC [Kofleriaceae bacterium]